MSGHQSARTRPNTGGYRVLLLVAAVVVTTSCTNLAATPTTAPAPLPSTSSSPPMTPTTVAGPSSGISPAEGGAFPMPPPGTCHLGSVAGQPMPDEHCSPGATNPAVTQATIHETICKAGWTATVRPPVAVTDAIKAQSARAYSIPAGTVGELDHKIALEVGGDPGNAGDVANLWFEPGPIPNPKDTVERVLNRATCAGLITLTTAQTALNHSWPTAVTDAGLQLGQRPGLPAGRTRSR